MFKDYDVYKLAAQKMLDDNFLLLDTETTGFANDDEIVELGIIDCRGNTLYSSLFHPEKKMNPSASAVSGITDEMLADKPLFKDEYEEILKILDGRPLIAFHEPFDERLFLQTVRRYDLDIKSAEQAFSQAHCCQNLYNHYLGHERTKLEAACTTEDIDLIQDHRAVGDCRMTLALLERIADRSRTPDIQKYNVIRGSLRKDKGPDRAEKAAAKASSSGKPSYLELFQKGKSVEEISQIRGVKPRTVEDAIITLYEKGFIDDISFFIHEQHTEKIISVTGSPAWDGKLRSVKEKLPEDCTYACIKAVIARSGREVPAVSKTDPVSMLQEKISQLPERQMCKATFVRTGGVADEHTFDVSLFLTPRNYEPGKTDFTLTGRERVLFYQKAVEIIGSKALADYTIRSAEMVNGCCKDSLDDVLTSLKERAAAQPSTRTATHNASGRGR